MSRERKWLLVILLASAALSVLFAVRLPIQSGLNPDETSHRDYIRLIVENQSLIKFAPPEGGTLAPGQPEPWETHQPPLYYLLCAPVYALSGGSVFAVRLVSAVIQLLTVVLAYRAGRSMFPSRPEMALGAAGFVAFLPTQAQLAGAINNDGLTTLLSVAVFWRLGLLVSGGQDGRGAAVLGALLGVGLLTKLSILQLFPVVVLAYVIAIGAKRLTWGRAAALCAGAFGLALLISSPWLIRNTLLYGDPLTLRIFPHTAPVGTPTPARMAAMGFLPTPAEYWRTVAVRSFASFWFIVPPNRIQPDLARFLPVVLLALGGIVGALRAPERGGVADGERRILGLAAAAILLLVPFFVRFNQQFFQAQGRYFLPALLPVAIVTLVGWGSVAGPGKRSAAAVAAVGLVLLALCLLQLFQIASF